MRTFQSSDGKKFWNINVGEKQLTMTAGKVGSGGRTSTLKHATSQGTRTAAHKLIREKLSQGYVETTHGTPTLEGRAFEQAIAADSHDGTGWRAYADYLVERNDPRGEFMQVQLALEDESRPKAARKKLQEREKELLQAHEREWLGELADALLDQDDGDSPIEYRWQRGFLASVTAHRLSMWQAQALASSPQARFLAELRVDDILGGPYGRTRNNPYPQLVPTPAGVDGHSELFELIGSPNLAHLRVFQIGPEVDEEQPNNRATRDRLWYSDVYRCSAYSPGIEHVIAGMTHIEELHLLCGGYDIERVFSLPNLTHLRVFRAYHLGLGRNRRELGRYEYPLDVLARNSAVTKLTHLLFHPHGPEFHIDHYGQPRQPSFLPLEQLRAVLRSKYLQNLTHIQFRLSNMGDDGVREIIASGALKRLKWLDLRHGCITDEGAKLFAECCDSKNLERLDLSRNGVTAKGLAQLRKAKVNAVANYPLSATALAQEHYLAEGDFE